MEIRDYLADERAVVFLYKNNEKGGETCGCIWGYPKVFLDEKRLFVQLLQVHPEYRGRGIGKTLLSRLEKYAVENGYDAIDMITSASMMAPLDFMSGKDMRLRGFSYTKFSDSYLLADSTKRGEEVWVG